MASRLVALSVWWVLHARFVDNGNYLVQKGLENFR